MGLLDTKVLKPMRGTGSARLNAQRFGTPITNNSQPRRGLLSSATPVAASTFGSPDFIQQLLLLLEMINRIDSGSMQ